MGTPTAQNIRRYCYRPPSDSNFRVLTTAQDGPVLCASVCLTASICRVVRSSARVVRFVRPQFFDPAFSKQHPHAARYLATIYAQPAWLHAATAPLEPPSKAFTFADAVNGRTFAKDGGQHAAAHVERYKPLHWSGEHYTLTNRFLLLIFLIRWSLCHHQRRPMLLGAR